MGEVGGGERWCVVTGGRGFAARHLVEMLLRSGEWCVRVADLVPSIKLEPQEEDGVLAHALHSSRASYVSADLRNKAQAIKGNTQGIFLSFLGMQSDFAGFGPKRLQFSYV